MKNEFSYIYNKPFKSVNDSEQKLSILNINENEIELKVPEFVLGCYNVLDGTFKKNHKYYENLNPEQQKVIFDEVLKNYLSIIDEAYGIDNYKDILQAIGWEFPEIEPEIKSEKTRQNSI